MKYHAVYHGNDCPGPLPEYPALCERCGLGMASKEDQAAFAETLRNLAPELAKRGVAFVEKYHSWCCAAHAEEIAALRERVAGLETELAGWRREMCRDPEHGYEAP